MAITSSTQPDARDGAAATPGPPMEENVVLSTPGIDDGAALWRLARDSRVLDVNTPYAYLLWCRDFADTSIVAYDGDRPVGFVTGYLRPSAPQTLMIWQVAVDEGQRGRGLAGRMLNALTDRVGPSTMETTISPGNEASMRLFAGFARGRGADVAREVLFDQRVFPAGEDHEPEVLFRIAPLR